MDFFKNLFSSVWYSKPVQAFVRVTSPVLLNFWIAILTTVLIKCGLIAAEEMFGARTLLVHAVTVVDLAQCAFVVVVIRFIWAILVRK
jgi:hypothetical protein